MVKVIITYINIYLLYYVPGMYEMRDAESFSWRDHR